MNHKEYCEDRRNKAYAERVGKVYGDYEVINVEWDSDVGKQVWTMRCTHCGNEKVTASWRPFVTGRSGRCMRCNSKTKSLMIGQKIMCWEVKRDVCYDLGNGEYRHDVEMECVKCGLVRFGDTLRLYERCPRCGAGIEM